MMTLAESTAIGFLKNELERPSWARNTHVVFGLDGMQIASSESEAYALTNGNPDDYSVWDIEDLIEEIEHQSEEVANA